MKRIIGHLVIVTGKKLVFLLRCGIKLISQKDEKCQRHAKYVEKARYLDIRSAILIRLRKKSGSLTCSESRHSQNLGSSTFGFVQGVSGPERSRKFRNPSKSVRRNKLP